jgi:exonuclease V
VGRQNEGSSKFPSGYGPKEEVPDLRSPLERFRTKPKKTLSVTDLISPSWCELQYWYSLTKHGKKRSTPAMRQGSAVHKTLEDQVHQNVPVDVVTKEDGWGLRIWNVIQGLRTLRETGMTRELEVWGLVDGLVVNGVIDELSYMCPDRELEEAAGPGRIDGVPTDQTTIENFFSPAFAQNKTPPVLKDIKSLTKKTSRIYLTDVKTRGVDTVPRGAAFRPTLMQLMLYHRLLSDLATNQIDPAVIFDRYSLDPATSFSDSLIAQLGNLNETFYEAPSDPDSSQELFSDLRQPPDAIQQLLDHNSLEKLWALMIQEFQQTMVNGAASIGSVLKVEYRTQRDGSILGIKTFLYDDDVIQSYLEDEIRWWRGEREAQGVCEEEAYKCGSCEFADECTWRIEKIEQATERHRARTRSVV